MSTSAAFCFNLSGPVAVLLAKLEERWVKGLPHRFVYLENSEDPNENYSRQTPSDARTTAFAKLVQAESDAAIERFVQHLNVGSRPPIGEHSARPDAEIVGTGWLCKIGDFYSVEHDMDDFLAVARIIFQASMGRLIYLRDSYSFWNGIWAAELQRIQLSAIAHFPPDSNSRECFVIDSTD